MKRPKAIYGHYGHRVADALERIADMAAGLSERVWEIADLVELLTAEEMALAA